MSAAEWATEQEVDADRAAALVGAQFPALRGAPVRPLAAGWDNTVHVVDDAWAFRFPRRAVALPGVLREVAVLPVLAGRLPLPVPHPELVGRPADGYPWPFTGSRLLPGVELAASGLADRTAVAAQVGELLRVLHAVPPEALPPLPVDPLLRGAPRVRAPQARERLARLAAAGLAVPDAEALLADAEPLPDPSGRPVVVHGDLHVRHVLVDGGDATGVIDWGDVCLADPAVDLALAYSAVDGSARSALLAAYGAVDVERELRARVLALVLSAALAEYAHGTGDAVLLAEALAGTARAVG